MHGWQPIGGRWSEHDGVFSNATYGRGDMLIAQHSDGSNYTISADIRFDLLFPETHYGDAGLVIRTTNPEPGVDSYQGYYAGLRPDQQAIVLGAHPTTGISSRLCRWRNQFRSESGITSRSQPKDAS
jgi:hypothetical protein